MNQALNVVAIMKSAPGKEAELRDLLLGALTKFQAEPGCLAYTLLADIEHPARFVTYEKRVDEAALEAHMKAPTLSQAMPILSEILAEPMQQLRLNALPGSTV